MEFNNFLIQLAGFKIEDSDILKRISNNFSIEFVKQVINEYSWDPSEGIIELSTCIFTECIYQYLNDPELPCFDIFENINIEDRKITFDVIGYIKNTKYYFSKDSKNLFIDKVLNLLNKLNND